MNRRSFMIGSAVASAAGVAGVNIPKPERPEWPEYAVGEQDDLGVVLTAVNGVPVGATFWKQAGEGMAVASIGELIGSRDKFANEIAKARREGRL